MQTFTKQHLLIDKVKEGKIEYLNDLYDYYHYIAEKYYNKYDGKSQAYAKSVAEEMLKNSIIEYFKRDTSNSQYAMAKFIHSKFQCFEKKYFLYLEEKSYQGDRQAKIDILNKYKYLVDKYVLKLLNKIDDYKKYIQTIDDNMYLDDDFNYPDNIISMDDIYQDYYCKIWYLINNYYSKKLKTDFVCNYLSNQLGHFTNSYFRIIKIEFLKKLNGNEENINDDFFQEYITDLENRDISDKIESSLSGNLQLAYHGLRNGKTRRQLAVELNISKARVAQCIPTAKKIVKRKGIKR